MLRCDHITKSFAVKNGYKTVLDDVSVAFPDGKSVALLGQNGAGKSTLLHIIAGTLQPDRGTLTTDRSISWPVGFAGSFHGEMTGAQNVRFIARIYGVDTYELEGFVEDFAELGAHFNMPVRSYSSGMRSRLAFGASMGIGFDTYLVDEVTAVGDQRFRRKSRAVFLERMRNAGALVVNHDMNQIRQLCDVGCVLHNGGLEYFDDLGDAIARHEALMA
ncbi:ABC transporter ATP-binding protein [Litorivita pollutaquae]|uniref:ABC transporter ATP-binding protein n=1 Tax=Litorivita pollutaquae TaxID=2200892 RepID=A0A2V4NRN9_9RHOB|nr:ABC transporter ATP-binding protein [Litorivita pollutaquae]OUS19585.1 ABC transporter ATP-binding protein [Rhodobacterales bacterium 59_46_T64]PYC47386.1 ABC transporter ATP-binding protein [Litorivita pollutaquae]